MQVWKNSTGIFASLVVVIGVVTLRCTLSWAQVANIPHGKAEIETANKAQASSPNSKDLGVNRKDLGATLPQNGKDSSVTIPQNGKDASVPAPQNVKDARVTPPLKDSVTEPVSSAGKKPSPALHAQDNTPQFPGIEPSDSLDDKAPLPVSMPPAPNAPVPAPGIAPDAPPALKMPPAPNVLDDEVGLPPVQNTPQPPMPSAPSRTPPPGFASPPKAPDDALPSPDRIERMPSRGLNTNANPRTRDDRVQPRSGGGGKGKQIPANEADMLRIVPQTCAVAKGRFIWNFEDEELITILRLMSNLMCRTIVVNDAIGKNQKMTIFGKDLLTPKDAWDVSMASLASKGLALIEQGKTWTVVKRSESKSYPTPMYFDGKQVRSNEEVGTFFYKSHHASQEALKNVARLLITKDGMVDIIGDQHLIIIDSNSNIKRLAGIFEQIDVDDATSKVHIVSLMNADAKSIEKQLRELFDVTPGTSRAARRRSGTMETKAIEIEKIIADERTNSVIIVSDKDAYDKVKEIVALIDQPATDQTSKGKIHVKKLKFADAKKIAETLNNVVQQGKSSRFGRRRGDESTAELFDGEVKITAHENTNTLVTVASANDYRSLLTTINSLDVRKEQVYVEAVILDIQVNDNNDFGINLFGGLDPSLVGGHLGLVANPGGAGMVQSLAGTLAKSGASTAATGLGTSGMGALAVLSNFLNGGIAISGKPIPNTDIPSFGAILQAISRSTKVDVLSTPYLLTTDNQEAEMSVGEKVPVVRGTSMAGAGGGIGAALGVPLQNIAYEDVKLTFKITPHVGADDNVRLDINQEVNELGAQEDILNQKQYRIRTKSAKTQLVLKDQQTGVIGGLIGHSTTTSDNKVPILGDIPVLGWLFKNRNTQNARKNLLLIVTPYIIRTDDDYKKILDKKLKEREEFSQMYYGGKVKTYNKFVDYDKKAGPLSSTFLQLDGEMSKAENGGAGSPNETIITPKVNGFTPANEPESSSKKIPTGKDETVRFEDKPNYSDSDFILDEFNAGKASGKNEPTVPGYLE